MQTWKNTPFDLSFFLTLTADGFTFGAAFALALAAAAFAFACPGPTAPDAEPAAPLLFVEEGALSPWIPKNVNFLLPAVIDDPIPEYFLKFD